MSLYHSKPRVQVFFFYLQNISKMKIWLLATKRPYLSNGRSDWRANFTSGRRIKKWINLGAFPDSRIFEIWASKVTQLVENCAKIMSFFCEDAFSRGPSVSYTRLAWSSITSSIKMRFWGHLAIARGNTGSKWALRNGYDFHLNRYTSGWARHRRRKIQGRYLAPDFLGNLSLESRKHNTPVFSGHVLINLRALNNSWAYSRIHSVYT
jgi:hypothetical protein